MQLNHSSTDQQEYLVLRYPLLSSILIVLCVFQFIFPSSAIWFQHCIMDHFSCVSYIHFPEFHYEILEVCMDHNGADVFPGSY